VSVGLTKTTAPRDGGRLLQPIRPFQRFGYTPVGPARTAMYDPPWTIPFLRRNEVVIPIERIDGSDP